MNKIQEIIYTFLYLKINSMRLLKSSLMLFASAGLVLSSPFVFDSSTLADKQACVITSDGVTVCGKPTNQPKKSNLPPTQEIEVNNFVFTLNGCSKSKTTIQCSFIVAHPWEERNVHLNAHESRLVDSNGNSYPGSRIKLVSAYRDVVGLKIVPGVGASGTIKFENISGKVTRLQLLEISLYGSSKNPQFRNVIVTN